MPDTSHYEIVLVDNTQYLPHHLNLFFHIVVCKFDFILSLKFNRELLAYCYVHSSLFAIISRSFSAANNVAATPVTFKSLSEDFSFLWSCRTTHTLQQAFRFLLHLPRCKCLGISQFNFISTLEVTLKKRKRILSDLHTAFALLFGQSYNKPVVVLNKNLWLCIT